MKNEEIRDLSSEDLMDKISNTELALNKMRMDHAVSELENPMNVRHTRKLFARLMTEQRKRQLQ